MRVAIKEVATQRLLPGSLFFAALLSFQSASVRIISALTTSLKMWFRDRSRANRSKQLVTHSHNNAGKVFNTPELFEAILLELPPLGLVLAQRVSMFWHDTIMSSTRLRQKLFLKRSLSRKTTLSQMPIVNPMLERVLYLAGVEAAPVIDGAHTTYECQQVSDYDPWDKDEKVDHGYSIHIKLCGYCGYEIDENDDLIGSPFTFFDNRAIPSGSWSKMLVSDPPFPVHFISGCDERADSYHTGECEPRNIGELISGIDYEMAEHLDGAARGYTHP